MDDKKLKQQEEYNQRTNSSEMDGTTKVFIVVFICIMIVAIAMYFIFN